MIFGRVELVRAPYFAISGIIFLVSKSQLLL